MCIHVYIYIYTSLSLYMYTYISLSLYIYAYIYIYIFAYIYIYTYTYICGAHSVLGRPLCHLIVCGARRKLLRSALVISVLQVSNRGSYIPYPNTYMVSTFNHGKFIMFVAGNVCMQDVKAPVSGTKNRKATVRS